MSAGTPPPFSVRNVPCLHSLWSSGRAQGKSAEAVEINRRLDKLRASALATYREQSAIRDRVTAEEVKWLLLGMAYGQETLLDYFRMYIAPPKSALFDRRLRHERIAIFSNRRGMASSQKFRLWRKTDRPARSRGGARKRIPLSMHNSEP